MLDRMGVASAEIVDLSYFPVETLMHIQEAYKGQRLGLELLQRTGVGERNFPGYSAGPAGDV